MNEERFVHGEEGPLIVDRAKGQRQPEAHRARQQREIALGACAVDQRRPDHRDIMSLSRASVFSPASAAALGHAVEAARRQDVVLAERRAAFVAAAVHRTVLTNEQRRTPAVAAERARCSVPAMLTLR